MLIPCLLLATVYDIPFIIAVIHFCIPLTYISVERRLQVCEMGCIMTLHESVWWFLLKEICIIEHEHELVNTGILFSMNLDQ
jgi:hypothetical protein